jgi:hypothetical protein
LMSQREKEFRECLGWTDSSLSALACMRPPEGGHHKSKGGPLPGRLVRND